MLLARHAARGRLIQILLIVAFIGVEARLVVLQVVMSDEFKLRARSQMEREEQVVPRRGLIFDRRGKLLAGNVDLVSVYAHPKKYRGGGAGIRRLAKVLDVPEARIRTKLRSRKSFVWLKRKTDFESRDEAAKLSNIPGIGIHQEPARIYPMGRVASHIIGFAGMDNEGLEGLELAYEDQLRGRPGFFLVEADALGRKIPGTGPIQRESIEGFNLHLTLDARIQQIVERELREGVRSSRAKAGMIMLVDPHTGAIVALANYPDYDGNVFWESGNDPKRNRTITDMYEPGSTFKIVTAAGALHTKTFGAEDTIYCENGTFAIAGRIIHDHSPHAWLSLAEVFAKSSNIGMVKVGIRVGPKSFRKMATAFGFGEKTGIDLPGEVSGRIKNLRHLDESTLASISYGQEVLVTTIQMSMAISAIANGGNLLRPYLVKRITTRKESAEIFSQSTEIRRRVFDEEVAADLSRMLRGVVEGGTGRDAKPAGYTAAGKTGTAQKVDPKTRTYMKDRNIISFAGFAPAEKPALVAVVVLDEPGAFSYGGAVAGPIFARVMDRVLPIWGIPRRGTSIEVLVHNEDVAHRVVVPDWTGMELKNVLEAVQLLGLEPEVAENQSGPLIDQSILPGSVVRKGTRVVLRAGPQDVAALMPDLRGKPLRAALAALGRFHPRIKITGSGLVAAQSPAPGTKVGGAWTCFLRLAPPPREKS